VNANVAIGIDTFIVENLSIGVDAELTYGDSKGYGATTLDETVSWSLAGGVRFGVNVPLGSVLSWYPRLTLGFSWDRSDVSTIQTFAGGQNAPPSGSTSKEGPWFNLYLPILVHPVPHFFLGLGPRMERHFGAIQGGPYDGSETTLVSVAFTVGGFWGGPANGDDAGEPAHRVESLGRRGTLVLTNATTASVGSFGYSRSNASTFGVTLAPGFDYFVSGSLSLGADIAIGYSSGSSLDTAGTETTFSGTSFGLAPRIGAVLPLASDLVSLWPLVEVGYGIVNTNQSSAFGVNMHNKNRSWVQLSLPIVVVVAAPFFVGAGPFFYQELSDSDQNGYENNASLLGASFLLGGWL
jgi:hypothetical protein